MAEHAWTQPAEFIQNADSRTVIARLRVDREVGTLKLSGEGLQCFGPQLIGCVDPHATLALLAKEREELADAAE